MKKNILRIVLMLLIFCSAGYSQTSFFTGGNICRNENWHLVFADEFNGDSLNDDVWFSSFPCNDWTDQCEGARVNDGEIHFESNVVVSNGTLKLIAKHETATWYSATREYTAGMIHSKGDYRFGYGKFELYGKIASGQGFYSTFWMFGGDGAGTATELDVFEIYGETPYHFHPGILKYHETEFLAHQDCAFDTIDLSLAFHLYSVEWDPFFITFKIDERPVYTISRYRTLDGTEVTWCCVEPGIYVTQEAYPPGVNNVLSVIATLVVLTEDHAPDNTTVFPNQFEIDYIRVYQRDSAGVSNNECNVILFPNPVRDNLFIRSGLMKRITVKNIWGQEMFSQIVNTDEAVIDISRFKNGIYFVQVEKEFDILSGKFIKI